MKKKLMSLLMTAVLCIGMFTTVSAEPVTEGNVAIATVEPTGGSVGTEVIETLPVPANLRWSNNFDPQWDVVGKAHGHYLIEVYKDGAPFYSSGWSLGDYEGKQFEQVSFSPNVNESGTYTFRVASNNSWDPENTVASAYSDWSEPKVYVRPEAQLGTTVGYWDSEEEGVFCYFGVENAGGYRLNFYEIDENGNYRSAGGQWYVGSTNYDTSTNLHREDLTHRITDAGKYAVSVQALSADISTIANGVEGAKSAVFNTGVTSDKVEETLNELPITTDPNGSLETVKEEFGVDELRTAMQTDDEVLAKMEELDDAYAAANGITVGNDVDAEVEALGVKADQIDMVGAALNTGAGDVTLEMNVTKEEDKVDVDTSRYKNSVQLDLKLNTENGYKSELEVPITITMPVPTGIDAGKLTIIHYCQDGTTEIVHPKNNGNGTITFTVTKFSTFVFAEEKASTPPVQDAPSVGTDYVSAPIESEHTLADGKEVRMITVDGNSSVYVIGDKNYIPSGSVFNSDAVTEGAVYTKAANAVNKKFGAGTIFSVYEMTLKNASGEAIQPGGYIDVTLPIPGGMTAESGKTIWAYRLEANGKLTKLDTAVSSNQVTFATNHFSTYVLVEVNAMTSPKTGDTVGMMPTVVLMLTLASVAVIVSKKKFA